MGMPAGLSSMARPQQQGGQQQQSMQAMQMMQMMQAQRQQAMQQAQRQQLPQRQMQQQMPNGMQQIMQQLQQRGLFARPPGQENGANRFTHMGNAQMPQQMMPQQVQQMQRPMFQRPQAPNVGGGLFAPQQTPGQAMFNPANANQMMYDQGFSNSMFGGQSVGMGAA